MTECWRRLFVIPSGVHAYQSKTRSTQNQVLGRQKHDRSTSDGSETNTKDTKENPQSLKMDEKETGDRDRNGRPSWGSTRGLGRRVRSESLNHRARSKEQSNKSQNVGTDTPRREQMNIIEFLCKRKPTGTPLKKDGKQPKQPNMRDRRDSTHDGSGSTSTTNDGQNAASNSAVS